MIYDGDTGGKPEHFQYTVRTQKTWNFCNCIEDKTGLKKNSLFGTQCLKRDLRLIFTHKIRTGKNSQITETL